MDTSFVLQLVAILAVFILIVVLALLRRPIFVGIKTLWGTINIQARHPNEPTPIKEKLAKQISESSNTETIPRIAIWGISQSGKSWLLTACYKNLLSKRNEKGKVFPLGAMHRTGKVVVSGPEQIESLTVTSVLKTEPVTLLFKYRNTEKYVSCDIDILDYPGEVSKTLSELKYQQNFIFVLDPTSFDGDQKSRDTYINHINDTCYFICSETIHRPIHLAICISKIDKKDGADGLTGQDCISKFFGDDTLKAIDLYKIRTGIKIEYFATSSVGYFNLNGVRTPNWDDTNKKILRPLEWAPEKAEEPFIWLVEHWLSTKNQKERLSG
ncbi:hypothetical protein HY990_01990 [Candidatus Micrarchaeota archaeon]|nr:hypothetical protein [Candidatus Micrarchaeota archaeon]